MGGLFGSIKIPGNRLTDLVGQTSTVGRPIPFGYGRCRITEPNVIWTAGIPKEHVRRKKQGKGGVKTEEYTYTLSYAIAFMAGPTYGYLTIKRGGKVVYTTDPNAPIEDKAFAAKWLQKARLYHGTEEQLPDPTIESYKGAGQVSAHRGLSYIVVTDDDVTAEGGSIPQYEAVIQATPPDVFLTSKPYPNDARIEETSATLKLPDGVLRPTRFQTSYTEQTSTSLSLGEGSLRSPLVATQQLEEAEAVGLELGAGVLVSPLRNTGFGDTVDADGISLGSGVLAVKLIKYQYWPAESTAPQLSLQSGYLGA